MSSEKRLLAFSTQSNLRLDLDGSEKTCTKARVLVPYAAEKYSGLVLRTKAGVWRSRFRSDRQQLCVCLFLGEIANEGQLPLLTLVRLDEQQDPYD